jgi:quercetin dioxygenase-like cupin family protein
MKPRLSFVAVLVLAVVTLGVHAEESVLAQYERRVSDPLPHDWENDWMRLSRISTEPGAGLAGSSADRVVVYLTADPEGRMPLAEAVWQPAGSGDLQNRGRARVEALAIELKEMPAGIPSGTPPEVLPVSYRADVWTLIDNSRVLVTKHRYAPATYVDPLHFHAADILVVYLRGGYTWPAVASWGSYRVRRGEVDVVPANTFHTLGNAGADPLEFLVIMPR